MRPFLSVCKAHTLDQHFSNYRKQQTKGWKCPRRSQCIISIPSRVYQLQDRRQRIEWLLLLGKRSLNNRIQPNESLHISLHKPFRMREGIRFTCIWNGSGFLYLHGSSQSCVSSKVHSIWQVYSQSKLSFSTLMNWFWAFLECSRHF